MLARIFTPARPYFHAQLWGSQSLAHCVGESIKWERVERLRERGGWAGGLFSDAYALGPCIPNFFPKFESSFESERVFRESRRVRKARTLQFRLVPTLIFANFREFLRIFAKIRVGHYRNISEIRKKSISETRENENFGKKCLTQGLNMHTSTSRK